MNIDNLLSLLKTVNASGPVVILQQSEVDESNVEIHKTRFSIENTSKVIKSLIGANYCAK